MTSRAEYENRFWSRVDVRGPDECWPWIGGGSTPEGYGQFWMDGQHMSAPRAALIFTDGAPASPALFALHHCDNPPCCNGAHLYWGTHAQNMADKIARDRFVRCPGERNGNHKLTDGRRRELEALLEEGNSVALAARFGVSGARVRQIRQEVRARL